MKIAISIQKPQNDTMLDARFGRAEYFAIVDTDSKAVEFVENPAIQSAHGAGVETSQMLLSYGVQKAVSGAFGPNAVQALKGAGIEMEIIAEAASLSLAALLAKLD